MTDLAGDWTEAVDADIPRVDLVGRAANGTTGFLLMKQDAQAGLLDPSYVRDLIGKSEPEPPREETVTMTGSPGAIAKLMHEAAQRARTRGDVTKAPDNADDSLQGDVTKETETMDDALDPTVILAEPDSDAPGIDTDPGSPAWEAVDAATARKWTSILARAKAAVDMLAEREMLEAAGADPDDIENAFDLQDACCALDYAISVLAPFAVAEQAEADFADDMAMVGKALHGFDTAPLDTIEALSHVRKAGRVLSAANEQTIRGAVESLQKVLASLPTAPVTEEGDRAVAKTANEEPDMPTPTPSAEVNENAGQEPAMGAGQADPKPVAGQAVTDMAKADGEKTPMVVVYDQKGRLIGIVDPGDVTPVANSEADADDMDDAEPAADDAAPETTDLTPEPPAEAGTPADAVPDDEAVTKNHQDTTTDMSEMFKSSLLAAVESAFTEHSANQNTVLAKQGEAVLELADLVKELKGRIGELEEQPAQPKVFTNGAVPPRDLRGMDRGASPVDAIRAADLRKQLYSPIAADQNAAHNEMQQLAIDKLQEIHQRR